MEEKKIETNPCEKENKKISKRYLAFYIIGLFSVALVLILLSYVTQLRADKQLASLNSELAERDTTVQGVQQKLLVLQETVSSQDATIKEKEQQISELRTMLNMTADEDLKTVLKQRLDERDAYYHLSMLEKAIDENNDTATSEELQYLQNTYGLESLNGTAQNAVFTGVMAERYLELVNKVQ